MRGAKATRPCAACGRELTRLVSQARGENWYCDHSCQAAHAPHRITQSKTFNPERGKQETRPCVTCGTPVTRYLSQIRTTQAWSCSRSCAAKAKNRREIAAGTWNKPRKPRTGDMVECKMCSTPFYCQPAYAKRGRFLCSRACNRAWQARNQVEKPCAYCGKTFVVRPSETQIQNCSRECEALGRIARPLDKMHNGKPARKDEKGYVWLWEPDHPNQTYKGWYPEHRLVMEAVLGRYLNRHEQVDHINQIKDDNRIENLQVLDASTHSKKTNADNLGALKALRAQAAQHQRAMAEQARELAELKAQIAALESSTD